MRQRVLMIDDALPLHRVVEARLRGTDVELHSALDGAAGLAAAEHLRPSVVLLDVDLPDMDGHEVCRRLKAARGTADIPVIFLTADGDGGRRQAALDLGAVEYITKPFHADDLAAHLEASIRSRLGREAALGLDGVTGLWTRARMDRHLAGVSDDRTACIVADVDGLRLVNARHGPAFGDEALRAVAAVFLDRCGGSPAAASAAGGGRLVVALAGGDRRAARRLAESIRDGLAARPLTSPRGDAVPLSCSFGIADTAVAPNADLIGRAEHALAQAKRSGPARIAVARLRRPRAAQPNTEDVIR